MELHTGATVKVTKFNKTKQPTEWSAGTNTPTIFESNLILFLPGSYDCWERRYIYINKIV